MYVYPQRPVVLEMGDEEIEEERRKISFAFPTPKVILFVLLEVWIGANARRVDCVQIPGQGESRMILATKYVVLFFEHFRRFGSDISFLNLIGSVELSPVCVCVCVCDCNLVNLEQAADRLHLLLG